VSHRRTPPKGAAATSTVAAYSEAELASVASGLFGANLLGLWLPGGIQAGVNGWTKAVGNDLANSHVSNKFTRSSLNYGNTIYQATSADRSLLYNNAGFVMLSAWLICRSPTQVFTASRNGIRTVTGGGSPAVIQGVSGGVTFTSTNWAHYIDGAASETMPVASTGIHIVEAVNAGNTDTGIEVGGLSGSATTGWTDHILGVMALAAVPSAVNRAAMVAAFKTFFRMFR
jgi:hypothetical protein